MEVLQKYQTERETHEGVGIMIIEVLHADDPRWGSDGGSTVDQTANHLLQREHRLSVRYKSKNFICDDKRQCGETADN